MGGLGSGRWPRESGRQTSGELPTLDVRDLKREGLVAPGQGQLEGVACLEWTSCTFGGSRPWFVCPGQGCGRRAAILYGTKNRWLCRRCLDLAYASQRENRLGRARRRAERARRRLGPDDAPRPKGMHHTTFVRIRSEYLKAYEEFAVLYQERRAKLSDQLARRFPGVPPS